MGSGEGVDAGKASIVGGVSGAVPIAGAALAPFVRRFWTVPGLFDRSTGALTPKGEAAAKAGAPADAPMAAGAAYASPMEGPHIFG